MRCISAQPWQNSVSSINCLHATRWILFDSPILLPRWTLAVFTLLLINHMDRNDRAGYELYPTSHYTTPFNHREDTHTGGYISSSNDPVYARARHSGPTSSSDEPNYPYHGGSISMPGEREDTQYSDPASSSSELRDTKQGSLISQGHANHGLTFGQNRAEGGGRQQSKQNFWYRWLCYHYCLSLSLNASSNTR